MNKYCKKSLQNICRKESVNRKHILGSIIEYLQLSNCVKLVIILKFFIKLKVLGGVFFFGLLISCNINKVNKAKISDETFKKERIEGINYLADENLNGKPVVQCSRGSLTSLRITEVTDKWMEIYNTGNTLVCLSDYRLRAIKNNSDKIVEYTLPNYAIEPQTFAIIRFTGVTKNTSSDVVIVEGPALEINGSNVGFYELVMEGSTVDFVGFCGSNGKLPDNHKPLTTDSFTGCISIQTTGQYFEGSATRSKSMDDSDDASDWTIIKEVVTFGGSNDVVDTTDNDKDGIPDANEQPGTTFAGMPLYKWGARAGQRDIFVYINYMDGKEIKIGLDIREDSLEKIREVFSRNGFKVHFDAGNTFSRTVSPLSFNMSGKDHEVLYSTYVGIYPDAGNYPKVPEAVSVIYYKNRYMPINRFGIFHYVLLGNTHSDRGKIYKENLGLAELPGNDLLIFLGQYENLTRGKPTFKKNVLAAVLFHELGHNLGLRHGGFEDYTYKPNHFSSMNYGYVLRGVPETNNDSPENFFNRYLEMQRLVYSTNYSKGIGDDDFNIDYSKGILRTIDESKVTEIDPLGNGLGNIDWNFNQSNEPNRYAKDLNIASLDTKKIGILSDYNEWTNLKLPFDYTYESYNYLDFTQEHFDPSDSSTAFGFHYINEEGTSPITQCNFDEISSLIEELEGD